MWINHWSLWRMASAMPDLRLPSEPHGIIAAWPVPNYTARWQRQMCANNLPGVVTWKQNGRDSNLQPFNLRAQRPNHYATRPHWWPVKKWLNHSRCHLGQTHVGPGNHVLDGIQIPSSGCSSLRGTCARHPLDSILVQSLSPPFVWPVVYNFLLYFNREWNRLSERLQMRERLENRQNQRSLLCRTTETWLRRPLRYCFVLCYKM